MSFFLTVCNLLTAAAGNLAAALMQRLVKTLPASTITSVNHGSCLFPAIADTAIGLCSHRIVKAGCRGKAHQHQNGFCKGSSGSVICFLGHSNTTQLAQNLLKLRPPVQDHH